MVNTRVQVGKELKEKVQKEYSVEEIADWAYTLYLYGACRDDSDFEYVMLTLGMMEMGPEFEYSYKELNHIADDLINGRKVKL